METHEVVPQGPVQELKAERVQEEVVIVTVEEPFWMSLKAERVQEPTDLSVPISNPTGGTLSLAYEMSFNQKGGVTVELNEAQIVVHLFATGGLAAA